MQNQGLNFVKTGAFLAIAAFLTGASVRADPITVFAASSLRDATEALSTQFEDTYGQNVVLVFAATSAVARQLSQGAPADVVLLADQEWGDWLVDEQVVEAIVPFAGNRLVIAGLDSTGFDVSDLAQTLGDDVLAMAQVNAVPAGRYGKAALETAGLWQTLFPQIVQAANVRAALRFVEQGEAPFGIGYASDLVALPTLTEVYRFAPDSHPSIVYVSAQATPEGGDFMSFLQSDAAQSTLQDWGFTPRADLN